MQSFRNLVLSKLKVEFWGRNVTQFLNQTFAIEKVLKCPENKSAIILSVHTVYLSKSHVKVSRFDLNNPVWQSSWHFVENHCVGTCSRPNIISLVAYYTWKMDSGKMKGHGIIFGWILCLEQCALQNFFTATAFGSMFVLKMHFRGCQRNSY